MTGVLLCLQLFLVVFSYDGSFLLTIEAFEVTMGGAPGHIK